MIAKVLKHIVDELNAYLVNKLGTTSPEHQAEIIHIQSGESASSPGIKVALINVEEDKVYKNHLNPLDNNYPTPAGETHPLGGIAVMRVNLYVLFAFNQQNKDSAGYRDTLSILTHVLRFFQSYPHFAIQLPGQDVSVEIEYHNISLEDANNMWSNLGGEQKPSAMYKIQLLEIYPESPAQLDHIISENPIISSPDLGPDGETLFNPDGSPQGDTHEIKQQ
jgi:hypothetical protein